MKKAYQADPADRAGREACASSSIMLFFFILVTLLLSGLLFPPGLTAHPYYEAADTSTLIEKRLSFYLYTGPALFNTVNQDLKLSPDFTYGIGLRFFLFKSLGITTSLAHTGTAAFAGTVSSTNSAYLEADHSASLDMHMFSYAISGVIRIPVSGRWQLTLSLGSNYIFYTSGDEYTALTGDTGSSYSDKVGLLSCAGLEYFITKSIAIEAGLRQHLYFTTSGEDITKMQLTSIAADAFTVFYTGIQVYY